MTRRLTPCLEGNYAMYLRGGAKHAQAMWRGVTGFCSVCKYEGASAHISRLNHVGYSRGCSAESAEPLRTRVNVVNVNKINNKAGATDSRFSQR